MFKIYGFFPLNFHTDLVDVGHHHRIVGTKAGTDAARIDVKCNGPTTITTTTTGTDETDEIHVVEMTDEAVQSKEEEIVHQANKERLRLHHVTTDRTVERATETIEITEITDEAVQLNAVEIGHQVRNPIKEKHHCHRVTDVL